MRVSLASIVLAVAVAACASAGPAASTSSAGDSIPPTTSLATTTTLAVAVTTASPESTATTPLELDVEFVDGEVIGPGVFEVELGETVDIWIRSDVDDEMHVHGYDFTYALEAGEPLHLSFVADVPGIFEVEAHTGHTVLFEVEVSG